VAIAARAAVALGAVLIAVAPMAAAAQSTTDPTDEPSTTSTTSTTVAAPLPDPALAPPEAPPTVAPAAAGQAIRGLVVDGNTGDRQAGICVLFFAADQVPPAPDGFAITGSDGWFSFTPATDAPQQLLFARPVDAGDCTELQSSGPVPEWLYDQPADLKSELVPPRGAAMLVGPTQTGVCMGQDELYVGDCNFDPPRGPGTIAGAVRAVTGDPVSEACVFALAPDGVYGPAVSGDDGGYVITGLPERETFYVGFIPPFDQTGDGPCSTGDGPPPASADGQLQPEFYANTWIDLTNPELEEPAAYAASIGAVPVESGAVGIDGCLSTDPGTVSPRPTCEVAAAQAVAGDPGPGGLAFTGVDGTTVTAVVGAALVALGAGLLLLRRWFSLRPARVATGRATPS
jgi:hypothetical protein